MLWDVAQPLHSRGLEAHVGVEATRHGTVNDVPLLLIQKRDELSLGVYVSSDALVGVMKIVGDSGLLIKWRNWKP